MRTRSWMIALSLLSVAPLGCAASSAQGSPTDIHAEPPPSADASATESKDAKPPGSDEPTASAPPAKSATPASCTDLATELTNDPNLDGAVAMNNAQVVDPDKPRSDRLVPILQAVQKYRDAYRCCFDLWGRDHPGETAEIALGIELDPTGKLVAAKIKAAESTLTDPAIEACMAEVSKKIAFPESPSGKDTSYTHHFSFKARARR